MKKNDVMRVDEYMEKEMVERVYQPLIFFSNIYHCPTYISLWPQRHRLDLRPTLYL